MIYSCLADSRPVGWL